MQGRGASSVLYRKRGGGKSTKAHSSQFALLPPHYQKWGRASPSSNHPICGGGEEPKSESESERSASPATAFEEGDSEVKQRSRWMVWRRDLQSPSSRSSGNLEE
ncbi:hypothetical protein BT93_H0362 [Corymbia citriodora subsp. variegata]|nr:hypothetical protein BT93_H0362 [Corymbia citriodora subsp. variegata]